MKKKRKLKELKDEATTSEQQEVPSADDHASAPSNKMARKAKRKKKGLSKGDTRSNIKPVKNAEITENPFEPCEVTLLKNFADQVKTKDIQTLALNYLGCTQQSPEWCLVTNRGNGHKVCVVMVEALYPFIFRTMGIHMPHMNSLFPEGPIEVQNPGSDLFVTPAGSAVLEKEPRKKSNDSGAKSGSSKDEPLPPVQDYVLLSEFMLAHEYPAEDILVKDKTYRRFTGNIAVQGKPHPLYAIDCEMCKTAEGSEVTRIAIVDESLDCIYKTYIKPTNPIIDYVTAFSGITEELLKDVTTTLADVVKKINDILPPQAIFVGHSLENDLRALKLFHNKVIDTAIIYNSGKGTGFKPGLRWLAMKYLKAKIQDGTNGHDPSEDAMTCMRLVKLKVKKGPKFGMAPGQNNDNSLAIYLTRQGKSGVFIDKPIVAQQHCQGLAIALPATTDEQGLDLLTRRLSANSEFHWLHMYKLEPIYRSCTTIHDMINHPGLPEALKFIDVSMERIYSKLPADTLLVVFSGCSGYWKKPEFMGSDEAIKKLMANIVAQVRRGLIFLKVKN